MATVNSIPFTKENFSSLVAMRDEVKDFMLDALFLHANNVQSELNQIHLARHNNADQHAKLCIIKAILSPGAKLPKNIAAAKHFLRLLNDGWTPESDSDVKQQFRVLKYSASVCYPGNAKSLFRSWSTVQSIGAVDMTWTRLTELVKQGKLFGLQMKTRSWALALFDSRSKVFTIDRWMLRGFLAMLNIHCDSEVKIADGLYKKLSAWFTELVEELCGKANYLLCQWSMWNEFRHAGQHASHIDLVR